MIVGQMSNAEYVKWAPVRIEQLEEQLEEALEERDAAWAEREVLLRALRDAATAFRSEAKRGVDHANTVERTLARHDTPKEA